jgi:hypothetical protein
MAEVEQLFTFERGVLGAELEARFYALAYANAELRRGIRLEAGAEIQGAVGVEVNHPGLNATLEVAGRAAARLALIAQQGDAGLLAEACISLQLAASLRADASLTLEELAHVLENDPALPAVLRGRALKTLLQGTRVHVGGYAEGYLGAHVQGRAVLAGSVLPANSASDHAGFTALLAYGAAFIGGAGFRLYADIDLPDARRVVADLASDLAEELLDRLPDDAPEAIRQQLPLLLGIAADAAIAAGTALGEGRGDADTMAKALLGPFRERALPIVMELAVRSGVDQVKRALDGLQADFVPLDDPARQAAITALTQAKAAVVGVRQAASLRDAIAPLLLLLDAVDDVIDAVPGRALEGLATGVTVVSAAAMLLGRLLGDSVQLPASLARRTARELGQAEATPVTELMLVDYLTMKAGLDVDPRARAVLGWIAQATGSGLDDLVGTLWRLDVDTLDSDAAADFAGRLLAAAADVLAGEAEQALTRLAGEDGRVVAAVVRPLLDVLIHALRDGDQIRTAITDIEQRRLREELETLLLQLVGALLLRLVDTAAQRALGDGAESVRRTAEQVTEDNPALAEFFKVTTLLALPITPPVVRKVLEITADAMEFLNDQIRPHILGLLREVAVLPDDNPTRRAQLETLAGSDDPLNPGTLVRLWQVAVEDGVRLAVWMIGPSLELGALLAVETALAPVRQIVAIAEALVEAIGTLLEENQRNWQRLDLWLRELRAEFDEGLRERLGHGQQLDEILADPQLLERVLDAVRDTAWTMFVERAELDDAYASLLYPPYRIVFMTVRVHLGSSLPLRRLAEWIAEELVVVAYGAQIDQDDVVDDVAARAATELGAAPLQAPIVSPLLGLRTVEMSGPQVASTAVRAALTDPAVRDTLQAAHTNARNQGRIAAQLRLVDQQAQSSAEQQASLQQQLDTRRLDPGVELSCEIVGLEDDNVYDSGVSATIRVYGAKKVFVEDPPLITVHLGAVACPWSSVGWYEDNGALCWDIAIFAAWPAEPFRPWEKRGFVPPMEVVDQVWPPPPPAPDWAVGLVDRGPLILPMATSRWRLADTDATLSSAANISALLRTTGSSPTRAESDVQPLRPGQTTQPSHEDLMVRRPVELPRGSALRPGWAAEREKVIAVPRDQSEELTYLPGSTNFALIDLSRINPLLWSALRNVKQREPLYSPPGFVILTVTATDLTDGDREPPKQAQVCFYLKDS